MRALSLLLLGLLVLASSPAGAEPTTLRVSLQLPISNHLGVNLTRFKTEVEKRSKGRLVVEIYDNSKLYRDDEVVAAAAAGAVEMASTTSQQFTRKVPALALLEQPFLFNTAALVRAAVHPDGEIRRLLDQAVLKATGLRVLWWQSYGSTVVFSKKGREVRNPDGIRDQTVRVMGDFQASFAEYCGAVPILISASKQYQAAKDGVVEMVMTGITGARSRKLWEVTDAVTRTEHAPLEFLVVINEQVWQSLNPADRSTISDVARQVEQELRDQMADIEAEAYAFARQKGMKISTLDPNDVYEWRACGASLLDDFLVEGGELANRLMAAYARLRLDPCCNAGPEGIFSRR